LNRSLAVRQTPCVGGLATVSSFLLESFAGLTLHEAATALGLPPRSADRLWAFARAWLADALDPG
jgi:hypothetical protein